MTAELVGNMCQGNDSITVVDDYIPAPDRIVGLAELASGRFSQRAPGEVAAFETQYGHSKFKSLFQAMMPEGLLDELRRQLPKADLTADEILINRYDPGDFLVRHTDAIGGFWKFKLIFLQSSASHFIFYDDEVPCLVEEKPGRMMQFPLSLEHAVTTIEEWEQPKYSMVLVWRK
jgi:hypothetical protein